MVYCSKCGAQNPEGARYCNSCAAALALTESAVSQAAQPQQVPAPLPPQLQPGQKATLLDYLGHYQGLQYHWVGRFVAFVFDAIVIMAPVYVLLSIMGWLLGGFLGFVGLGGVVLFLYSAFFEYKWGATVGKMIMGLKVVAIDGKLELPKTMIRNITKIYTLFLLIEFVVTLFVETTDAHQRYLDKLARTTVVGKK